MSDDVKTTEDTVSGWLSTAGSLRGRLSELRGMKESLSHRTRYYGDDEKVEEPTYDIKIVDRMCVELQNALLKIDRAVKAANAKTTIELKNVDIDKLMSPIE